MIEQVALIIMGILAGLAFGYLCVYDLCICKLLLLVSMFDSPAVACSFPDEVVVAQDSSNERVFLFLCSRVSVLEEILHDIMNLVEEGDQKLMSSKEIFQELSNCNA